MNEPIDLGPCRAALEVGERGPCLVLLPGAAYPTAAPLLWFARELGRQRGWSTLEVLDRWRAERDEPFSWAQDRAQRALDAAPGDAIVVIGKSLASGAAGIVADAGLPAVWLTPLLDEATVVAGIRKARNHTLLVGGSADPSWVPQAIPRGPLVDVLEIDGLDHALQRPGDALASIAALSDVARSLDRFLDRVAAPHAPSP
jgi:hypothetical protein